MSNHTNQNNNSNNDNNSSNQTSNNQNNTNGQINNANSSATNDQQQQQPNKSIIMDHIHDRLYRYRAKRLRFLINGDKYFTGISYALNTEKIRSFDTLLNELTRSLSSDHLKLCKGVRYIFSQDGTILSNLTDFQDGQTYICSSTDTFIETGYRISNGMLNWLVRNSACMSSSDRVCTPKRQAPLSSPASQRKLSHRTQDRLSNASHNISNGNNNNINSSQPINNRSINRTPIQQIRQPRQQLNTNKNQLNTSHDNNNIDTNNESPLGNRSAATTPTNANRTPIKTNATNIQSTTNTKTPASNNTSTNIQNRSISTNQQHKSIPKRAIINANQQQQQKKLQAIQGQQQQTNIFGKEVIEKYDIGRPIGDGHFSVVYCCINKSTQEFCALKLIDKQKCHGRDDMIYNEVKILKQLNHPNIVKLIEEFDYSMQLYLILELVQDGDLFDAISTVTKFSEIHVATMIHNLSSALTYLHKQGIVHRDIKPENLLISVQEDGSQSVKLADFGLAVEISNEPLYNVCGTAFYVSPEMLKETGYDYKVDVWSTGVICFILLCGYPPFTSENDSNQDELFDAILAGDFQFAPPYWTNISQHAKNLIRCMLTVDPEKRYTAEQVFKHPWTMGTSSNFEGIEPMNISREIALKSQELVL